MVKPGKKGYNNHPTIEGGLTGSLEFRGPVPESNSTCGNGQLNKGSLKQTRRNSLSGDVHTPVEDHDMVSSLSHNIEIQTPVQVDPSAINKMVTASTGVPRNVSLLM